MGRKNRRKKSSYSRKMKVDPKKLIVKKTYGTPAAGSANESNGSSRPDSIEKVDTQTQQTDRIPQRGDIWFVDLGIHPGTSVQDGCRPVVVLSNDTANFYSETLTVVPMTTRLKKMHLPTHVIVASECGFLETSMVLGEQLTTVGKSALRSYVGRISCGKIHEIETAVQEHLGLNQQLQKPSHLS